MGDDAGTPPGLWDRVRTIAQQEMAKFAKSGFLRNAVISDGGLTIRGGFLQLLYGKVQTFYAGPAGVTQADGSVEQVVYFRRRDGSIAAALFDATGSGLDGSIDQGFHLFDRAGNIIFGEDITSGQGLARPNIPFVFYPTLFGGVTATNSTSFTTIWRATGYKLQPMLVVSASAVGDTTGGELRVMVNGTQFGATQTFPAAGGGFVIGPLAVAGPNGAGLSIDLQVRCTGAGSVQVVPAQCVGFQSA